MTGEDINYNKLFSDVIRDKLSLPSWLPIAIRDYYHAQLFAFKDNKIPTGMRTILPAFAADTFMKETWNKVMKYGEEVACGYAEKIIEVETCLYNLAYNNHKSNERAKQHQLQALKHLQKSHAELVKMKRFAEDFSGTIGRCDALIKEVSKLDGGAASLYCIDTAFLAKRESFKDGGKPAFMARHLKQYCDAHKVRGSGSIVANTVSAIYGANYEPTNIYNL